MRGSQIRYVAPALIVFAASLAPAQNWSRSRTIDTAVAEYQKKFKVPGMSIAVLRKGQIIYIKGFGFGKINPPQVADGNTVYRLASMSKSLTGVLAMDLYRPGKLDLKKTIRTYVPSLPGFHMYTVEQALSHLAGVRHYYEGSDPLKWQTKQYLTQKSALGLFQMSPPVSTPGAEYNYSTPAFTVVGAAIEKVANLPFMTYAALRFNQWGSPGIKPEMGSNPNRAHIFKFEDGKNIGAERDNLSWKYPGGGFEASARSLALFAAKLMNGNILPKSKLDQMWTARKNNAGQSVGYGLGWSVGESNGKRFADHSGEQNGADSYWRLFPDDKVAVVVLSNRRDHDPVHLGRWIGYVATTDDSETVVRYKAP